ncbi:hypothetical protein [Halomarina rubra]|uniref:Uncharacterized protein n=1 Tax=Halomarina rubra TaxID=2071873 RepID=A0ABD6AYZ3_9EURY|nr:hypothetical protein [Halomarina rubra]
MSLEQTVAENLGYTLLSGPVLAALTYLVGSAMFGTAAAVGLAVGVYALGIALVARRSEDDAGSDGVADADDPEDRERRRDDREKELAAEASNGLF